MRKIKNQARAMVFCDWPGVCVLFGYSGVSEKLGTGRLSA